MITFVYIFATLEVTNDDDKSPRSMRPVTLYVSALYSNMHSCAAECALTGK